MIMAHRLRRLALAMLAAISACGLAGPASAAGLDTLEALTEQWVALRTTLAEEKATWTEKEQHWEAEIHLLQDEIKSLQNEIQQLQTVTTSAEEEQADLLEKKEKFSSVLEEIKPAIDRAEANLRNWQSLLPVSISQELQPLFENLPKNRNDANKRSAAQRAQTVVALYTGIEELHQHVHAVQEIITDETGANRKVNVLYLGLSRAFAVSPANDWAAVGEPTVRGWRWTPHPQLASDIRQALSIYQQEETAHLVNLPLIPREVRP